MEASSLIKKIALDVKAKKELSGLSNEFVSEKILQVFKKNPKLEKAFVKKINSLGKIDNDIDKKTYEKFTRSAEFKEVVSSCRKELREVYGVFISSHFDERKKLLEELKKSITSSKDDRNNIHSLELHNKILALHHSTKERLPYYSNVYMRIFEKTGIPKTIVDLACGLNPLSYPYIHAKPDYYAYDLGAEDMEFVSEYFKIKGIKGEAKAVDLLSEASKDIDIAELTKNKDITFLFKAVDSLEAAKRHSSKALLSSISSKFVVVSFATKSIGGRKIIGKQKRAWFDKFLAKQGLLYSMFEIPNENFYIIKK
jgi:16S rRNA (guanine(1405)-N(7))-methyltransferase